MHNQIKLHEIIYKTEELLNISDNRYKITIQIANRAKRKKYEDLDIIDDPNIKPIIRSILEMVDEIKQPEIISD
uniref:Putative DNA-directed RNA polymerase subunit omega n=1 Tax=Gracilaria ferox TaxID=1184158 RepID=A0A345U730_9FLOR|nr:DNA-directed RNA polymerase omega chain [Gracilaria ferox]YP_010196517.1 DNA-directed RNA polymerase omega chain [Gracilaria cervicornis]AXI96266.1 DNA-directed RNA polymerase omega chain [Gracilaria ferox]UAD83914.1 DNA-directed RNA polymerase omega chain [Gracilaria cervicornis]UAD85750.1 DNA-directed RNA polymerase omega chain [Gracilaria ferox]